MKTKGFTLIELLAVIVILAILALIAIPRIADIIDNSEESATLAVGRNYLRAVEQAILNKNLKEKFNPSECEIQNDGNLVCDGKLLEIEMTGTRPSEGTIVIDKKVPVSVDGMLLDGYVLNMRENENLVVFRRIEDITPQGTYLMTTPSVSNADTRFLGQDKINRSQVETIVIKNKKKVPSNAIYSWDVSAAKDQSVMVWYTDVDSNGLYELYIGGEGGVKANPNSSSLFIHFLNLKSIDLKYLDTNKVTSMYYMFYYCEKLKTLDVSNFKTSLVSNMGGMFARCYSLTELDLSSFDTSKVTNMSYMFSGCSKVKTIDIRNAVFSSEATSTDMFSNNPTLTTIYVKDADTKTFIDGRTSGVTVTIAA